MIYRDQAFEFIELSKRATSGDSLNLAYARVLAEAGFDRFVCVTHSDFAAGEQAAVLAHTYPAAWAAAYSADKMYEADFVYLRAGQHRLPFLWDEPWLTSTLTPAERRHAHRAKDAGFRCGFTVPIMVTGEPVASCTHTSSSDYNPEALPGIHMMALFFHEALRRLSRHINQRPCPVLTSRQRMVLTLVAEGKSSDAIGTILGLSRHTVDEHITTLLQKYAVSSRVQAAVRAVQDGAISPR